MKTVPLQSRVSGNLRFRWVVLALLVLVFAGDRLIPLGFAYGFLYLPLLLLAMIRGNPSFVAIMTVLAIFATWAGLLVSPPQPDFLPYSYVIGNRTVATLAIVLQFALYRRLLQARSREDRQRREHEARLMRQQNFEALAESLPIQIWTATPEGIVDYVGDKLAIFAGLSRQAILDDWLGLLHPDDIENCLANWGKSLATGERYEVDFRLRRADGRYVWHLAEAVPERDESGAIIRWLGSASNIDDLRGLQEQARGLARRLQNTVESITDAFFTLDTDFRVTYVNENAARLLGTEPGTMLGQPIWEGCELGIEGPFARRFRDAMTTQKGLRFEEHFTPRDRWLDVRVYPSPEGLTVYFVDVTREREAQRELLLLRTAVARLNDIILITEAEPIHEPGPRVLFVNEAFERRTGYTAAEVIGRTPRLLQGPRTQRAELDRIGAAMAAGEPVRAELINYTKSGQEFWLELDMVPIADASGRYTHWVAVERDISERKRLEQKLLAAQRMEAVGHLTGGIAHDFNNLLTVVLGNADMLEEHLRHDPESARLATMIAQAADKGTGLVRSLLAFARRQTLAPQTVDVRQLIQGLVPILEASLAQHHQLRIHLPQSLWETSVDPAQLESALLNLVINADDAMATSGQVSIAAANITLDAAYTENKTDVLPGDYVELSVTDTGPGIEPALLERIFEPFFTTKETGKGSGLGLSGVFGFVKQSGGHVSVYSEAGAGTTFRLYLPRMAAGPGVGSAETGPAIASAGARILVVEDNKDIADLAIRFLDDAGYHTQYAAGGEAALALVEANGAPDLLFTDVIMPGRLSGPGLARELRSRYPGLPVLFTSGFAEGTALLDQQVDPDNPLLTKPYRRDQLLARVARTLAQAPGQG